MGLSEMEIIKIITLIIQAVTLGVLIYLMIDVVKDYKRIKIFKRDKKGRR